MTFCGAGMGGLDGSQNFRLSLVRLPMQFGLIGMRRCSEFGKKETIKMLLGAKIRCSYCVTFFLLPFVLLQFLMAMHTSRIVIPEEISWSDADKSTIPSSSYSLSTQKQRAFSQHVYPRWGEEGINYTSVIQFIQENVIDCDDHCVVRDFPYTIYVMDSRSAWVSHTSRSRNTRQYLRGRVKPTELIFQMAWEMLTNNSTQESNRERWPLLSNMVARPGAPGFPMIVWYGDFNQCNHNNWKDNLSVPIFTTCAHVNCTYAFPTPTYMTILSSKRKSSDWDKEFATSSRDYRWKYKIPKVVWRGSLTGPLHNYKSFRWRIGTFNQKHPNTLLDLGITRIPKRHERLEANLTKLLEGLAEPIQPMSAFQQYKAVLDIDGNSWSSRFGALLCYNSVLLKVEPEFVDYFYRNLHPWQHYIPVRADLSDLLEKAAFALDSANERLVLSIIANANRWCRQYMVETVIAQDVLDIWEVYLQNLNKGDEKWIAKWREEKKNLTSGDFNMITVQEALRSRI